MVELASSLAEALVVGGVRVAFTVPSIHNLELLKAFTAAGVELRSTRTELGAAHMADGYARVSCEPTVLLTSTGPGAGNATGGFATAAKDGSAVIHVSTTNFPRGGNVHGLHTVAEQSLWGAVFGAPVIDLGVPGAALSELVDLVKDRRPFSVLVPNAADRAGACAAAPPPAVPLDAVAVSAVEDAVRRWLAVDQRVLWIGGGARSVGTARLVDLAERTGAAVVTSVQGKDLFPADHDQFAGCTWNRESVRKELGAAGAVLVLGSRLGELSTSVWTPPFPPAISFTTGPEAHGFEGPGDIHLRVEAERAVDIAENACPETLDRSWATEVSSRLREVRRTVVETKAHKLRTGLAEGLGPNDIVICDMTKMSFHTLTTLDLPPGARFLFPGLLSMGFGLPAGLGASLAAPDRHVVVLLGDGCLLSVLPELDLAKGWTGSLSVVLFDDDGYGLLESRVPEAISKKTCRFSGPAWETLAHSFGVELIDVREEELGPVLSKAPGGFRVLRVDANGIELDWRGL